MLVPRSVCMRAVGIAVMISRTVEIGCPVARAIILQREVKCIAVIFL